MSMRRRGILLAVGVLALATVSVAATVQLLYFQLPEPEAADGPGLIRWMVSRDLSQETPDLRRRLLTRVKQILADVLAASDTPIDEQFDPKYRPQFWSNVDVLLKEWFYQQAELYAATPASQRPAMLDKSLEEARWLSKFRPTVPAAGGNGTSPQSTPVDPITSAVELMRKMNESLDQAPKDRQQMLREFASALNTRIAAQTFQGLINVLKGD
jgi:hypothetical protein